MAPRRPEQPPVIGQHKHHPARRGLRRHREFGDLVQRQVVGDDQNLARRVARGNGRRNAGALRGIKRVDIGPRRQAGSSGLRLGQGLIPKRRYRHLVPGALPTIVAGQGQIPFLHELSSGVLPQGPATSFTPFGRPKIPGEELQAARVGRRQPVRHGSEERGPADRFAVAFHEKMRALLIGEHHRIDLGQREKTRHQQFSARFPVFGRVPSLPDRCIVLDHLLPDWIEQIV